MLDDDAWGGENASGCGHQLEHDVEVDCANKAPWTAWGANRKDYLIKWHGKILTCTNADIGMMNM